MVSRNVSFTIDAKVAGAVAGLTAVGKAAQASQTAIGNLEKQRAAAVANQRQAITDIGNTAGKVGLAAAAGLGVTVKAAMDWETAWAGVNKTVDGSASQMAQLEGELRGLARTMPASHQEITATAEAAGQLGVAQKDITSFTKTMLMLGETTNLSADEAATSIAQMANVMQTAPEDVERVGAALVALGNDGASTESQILGMAQKIAGAGSQIGLAESDILAIANAAASMGIQVEAGGTAISRVFTDMAKATAQGGDDLDKFAEIAGVSADQFQRLFRESPAEAFEAFTSGLNKIKESGGDVFTTLEQIGLSDVRVSQALLGMAASGDLLSDSLKLGGEAFAQNAALSDEYAKRAETSAARVQVAWNQLKDASIDVGAAALPMFADVAEGAGDAASAFGQLPDAAKSATTGLLGSAALLGGSIWAGSKLITGIVAVKTAMSDLAVQSATTNRALATFGKGVQFIAMIEGLKLLDSALDDLFNTKLDGTNLDRALTALSQGRVEGTLLETYGRDLDGFVAKIDTLESTTGKVSGALQKPFEWMTGDSPITRAKDDIGLLDEQLAGLVDSGQADQAAAAFKELAAAAEAQGISLTTVRGHFEQYESSLRNAGLLQDSVGAIMGRAGDTLSGVGESLRGIIPGVDAAGDAMDDAASGAERLAGALKGLSGFLDKRDAVLNYEAAIDNLGASLKANGRNFDVTTAKGREVVGSLQDVARSAIQVAEHMKGADKRQFLRQTARDIEAAIGPMKKVPPHIQAIIDRLREAGRTKAEPGVDTKKAEAELKRLTAQLDKYGLTTATAQAALRDVASGKIKTVQGLINKYGITKAQADALLNDQASGKIAAIRGALAAIPRSVSSTITVTTVRRTINTTGPGSGPGLQQGLAAGGPVYGPGNGTSDSVAARLSHGEHVWTAREVANAGGHAAMLAMRSEYRFAEGGTADRVVIDARGRSAMGAVERAVRAGNEDRKRGNKDRRDGNRERKKGNETRKKGLRRQAKQLDKMVQASDELNKSVQQNFRVDPFSSNATLQGVLASLDSDKARAGDFSAAAQRAKKLGLDGGVFRALLASGNTAVLQDIDKRSEVAAIEKAWRQRNKATADLTFGAATSGKWAGDSLKQLEQELKQLRQQIKRMGKNVRDGARQGTKEGTDRERRRRNNNAQKGKRP